ncbi:hypothetical protein MRX96_041440 [Rhipicephalus microplus]
MSTTAAVRHRCTWSSDKREHRPSPPGDNGPPTAKGTLNTHAQWESRHKADAAISGKEPPFATPRLPHYKTPPASTADPGQPSLTYAAFA